jgi:hypothetical protein
VLRRTDHIAAAALLGFIAGGVCSAAWTIKLAKESRDNRLLVEYVPLPHHVPEHKGGASFRFAMAHDVIHERFAKHGPAHYRERDRLTREKLAKLAPDDPASFPLADDLAVGLDRLGRPADAVVVMRDKLAQQQERGLSGRDLYTSYANLGTFLIHANHAKAVAGDPAARERVREGIALVRKSVEVNPQAHFGRERWQVAIAEFLLAAAEKPELLTTFDCLGNRLALGVDEILMRQNEWGHQRGYGRPTDLAFSNWAAEETPAFFRPGEPPDDPSRWPEVSPIRKHITRVGAETGWDKVAVPSHRQPVPFDEPVLGIIGMWRQGGGANPHFALALGETMLRVGQRYIAWAAYERAARLAERVWPDPAVQRFLREHCRKRQAQIEETLKFRQTSPSHDVPWQHVSPPPPAGTVEGLRPQFEAELAHGEGYQREYQQYETRKIAAGASIADERFFDEFHAGRPPIASPVGPEGTFALFSNLTIVRYAGRVGLAWGMLVAGVAAMAAALLRRWRGGRTTQATR